MQQAQRLYRVPAVGVSTICSIRPLMSYVLYYRSDGYVETELTAANTLYSESFQILFISFELGSSSETGQLS
jgi:hypothetical protein